MSWSLLLWTIIIFLFILFSSFLFFRQPIPNFHPYSFYPPVHSRALRKTYFTLENYGFLPYTGVRVGRVTTDLALLDVKLAILFYSPEDLLHPLKKRKLEREKQYLIKHGWKVWQVRERELNQQFHQRIHQIVSLRK